MNLWLLRVFSEKNNLQISFYFLKLNGSILIVLKLNKCYLAFHFGPPKLPGLMKDYEHHSRGKLKYISWLALRVSKLDSISWCTLCRPSFQSDSIKSHLVWPTKLDRLSFYLTNWEWLVCFQSCLPTCRFFCNWTATN